MDISPQKVTVAITCYNAAQTIGRALTSAQRQNWANLEIIVADDCSSDGSVEVVEAFIRRDARIKLNRRLKNGGAAATRNTLIEAASGEFIVFFDDDDESDPQRVSRQLSALLAFEAEHPSALAACYASGERLYANGYVKPLPAIGSRGKVPHGREVADYLLFYAQKESVHMGAGTPTCALMARRRLFLDLGGFDASLRRVEDVDFAVRLALAGGYFLGTSECLVRQHATEGNDKTPEVNRDAEVALVLKHADYLRSVGRYHYAVRWPNLRFLHYKRRYVQFLLEFVKIFTRNPIAATRHILATGPKRLQHERRMRKSPR